MSFLKNFFAKNQRQEKLPKDSAKTELFSLINKILKEGDSIFTILQPKIFSMALENNIAQKYNEEIIVTSDKNLCIGFELFGYSYSAITPEEELSLSEARNRFFTSLGDDVVVSIVCKKEKILLDYIKSEIKNPYAKEIVDKWENLREAYQIVYYFIISTKNKAILGELNKFKDKFTKEKEEGNGISTIELDRIQKQTKSINYGLDQKANTLESIKQVIKNTLNEFKPRILSSDELINFFATYANMNKTNLKYSYELLTDCYITSDVEFKKDYIIFHTNKADNVIPIDENNNPLEPTQTSEKIYAKFISVKAYETENISSNISTAVLRENIEYSVFISCEVVPKEKALKHIKDKSVFAVQEAKEMLNALEQDIRSDREKLLETSYSILIHAPSLEELNEKTNRLKGVLENQYLAMIAETLNLAPLFFSFFPSRSNLNARKRSLQSSNLATMINLENDILGFNKNRWGNAPVTIFRHLSGSPYFFNFHATSGKEASGHKMIIGGTGTGKTALTQFLMANLFKYDINIFAMDKMRGMHNFTKYIGGEYHDLDDEAGFKLNPFSLARTTENSNFLRAWLAMMIGIDEKDIQAINNIQDTLKRLEMVEHPNFKEFHNSLETQNDPSKLDLKMAYQPFLDSIFNHQEDALNFKEQLSILNMDAIIKDKTLAGLMAFYIFHKLSNNAKATNKGFFVFVDELKDYLNNEIMREKLLEAILEVRKINGSVMVATQDIGFFKEIPKGSSFINNMVNFLIYPTKNEQTLEDLRTMANLTGNEISFLNKTNPTERKILLKRGDYSAILDVNLSRLQGYLNVFSSDAGDVKNLKALKRVYGEKEWRELYIRGHRMPDEDY